ncbi:hypothetical protein G5V59_27065 [Nocardioides sp. W3-2-3]|uniref:hypothetical protein n=1 Tax=Nocardioides convexus TaxID=2712224 RepID=UPI002418B312|nr:hypothetical protein [Nocardioides convexus]NHA02054.1 hypothetical protein [Nocardioides convexus]
MLLTFSPVHIGTWSSASNTALSAGLGVKTTTAGDAISWVFNLPQPRRIHWCTVGVDDAEYVAGGAPFGGTGGAGYSIVIDGGSPIVGTTSDQHRFGWLDLRFGNLAVDLGTLPAGWHEVVVTRLRGEQDADERLPARRVAHPPDDGAHEGGAPAGGVLHRQRGHGSLLGQDPGSTTTSSTPRSAAGRPTSP